MSAQSQYFYSQDFTSASFTNWHLAQFSSPTINTSSDSSYSGLGGGSVTMLGTAATSCGGEVRMLIRRDSQGGAAGMNALLGASLSSNYYYGTGDGNGGFTYGSFISVGSDGIYQVTSDGTWTQLHLGLYMPDNSILRAVYRMDGTILAYVNGGLVAQVTAPYSISCGYLGMAFSTNIGNVITHADLGFSDISAPNAISSSSIGKSPFTNHIDLQWPAATDNTGGSGVYDYLIYKGGNLIGLTGGLTFTDGNVSPSQTYSYTLTVVDYHGNSASINFSVQTPRIPTNPPYPSLSPDGQRMGVRPTGAYWGAGNENIDALSGNLNFSLPLLKALGRGGWGVGFSLSYNSQNWRQDSGGNWNFGGDVGYGYGWRLLAGQVIPVFADPFTIAYYLFQDATGAEYRLDQQNGSIWSSKESVYVWFDDSIGRLHFRDGSFWDFNCTSAATEADSGVLHPTLMEDTNGNQVIIRYQTAAGANWTNSSGRITEVEDVRAVQQSSGRYVTYFFNYNSNLPPHLTSITNTIGTGEAYDFGYLKSQSVTPPWGGSGGGTTTLLDTSTVHNLGLYHQFYYNGSGEMTKVLLPYKGYTSYDYVSKSYSSNGRTYREVSNRYLSKDGSTQTTYAFSHEASTTTDVHSDTYLLDPSGVGKKHWAFATSGLGMGLVTQYQGIHVPSGPATKTQSDFTWVQDSTGNSYIGTTYTTADPGQSYAAQSRTDQTVDVNGNVTQVKLYNYGNLTTPARTTNYTYLSGSAYTSRYILNRMTSVQVTDGTYTVGVASNGYDAGSLANVSGRRQWDSSVQSITARGNVTSRSTLTSFASMSYDVTGTPVATSNNGVSASLSTDSSTNFAAPTQITVGSQTDTLTYTPFLGLTNDTGANGASSSTSYDQYGRVASATGPTGASGSVSYNDLATPPTYTTTTNGVSVRNTRDGFGRTILAETLNGSSVVNQVEYFYDSCACSPAGKLFKQSMPHAPGTTPIWTVYSYDGIGRTVSVVKPDGASTTTYLYQGNTVTVTDPAGKWKRFTMDAFGNLVQVNEPNPAGGADYVTTYSYDLLNRLIGVNMPRPSGTQTRTFNYTSGGYVMNNLVSATNPENGTVSYTYGSNLGVATKTDAKGQKIVYSYDSLNRLTKVQRYLAGSGNSNVSTGKTATQSSTITGYGQADASLAVDGNTDGNFNNHSVSHTSYDSNAWWQVDLGASYSINNVVVWNRTDCCGDRLSDYWVFISDTPFGSSDTPSTLQNRSGTWNNHQTVAPAPSTNIQASGAQGRYVRVQLSGTNYLSLGEVQVFSTGGASGGSEDTCQQENYSYDSNPYDSSYSQNVNGRLAAKQYFGGPPVVNGTSCGTTFTEMYSYSPGGQVLKKKLRVTRTIAWNNHTPTSQATNLDLEATYTYSGPRLASVQYPSYTSSINQLVAGPNYGYNYDSLGRLSALTDLANGGATLQGATYGISNEMLTLGPQTFTYNSLLQLTRITASYMDLQYRYSATQNNGKITSQYDGINGEEVTYAYDSLNRLASAVTTDNPNVTQWGQSYTYDGFGNLTDQNVIKGSAPSMHVVYNAATNRQTTDFADANGNIGVGSYAFDIENRMTNDYGVYFMGLQNPTFQYSYAPGNKRVWRGNWTVGDDGNGNTVRTQTVDEVTFWSINGQKLAAYSVTTNQGFGTTAPTLVASQTTTWGYFGGKLVVKNGASVLTDRLASVGKFYPFGQEKPSATTNGTEKFATYFRDSETGLDYAVSRFHTPGAGRFTSPDPYQASGGPTKPGSWNRYAYVEGDPTNGIDPSGRDVCWVTGPLGFTTPYPRDTGCPGGSFFFSPVPGPVECDPIDPNPPEPTPPPEPAADKVKCAVDLYEQSVGGTPYKHTGIRIRIQQSNGALTETFIDGFANRKDGGGTNPEFGMVVGDSWLDIQIGPKSLYDTQAKRYPKGEEALSNGNCLQAYAILWQAGRFRKGAITYLPQTGPNSNSLTYTLLNDNFLTGFSLPQSFPLSTVPGWGFDLDWIGAFQ